MFTALLARIEALMARNALLVARIAELEATMGLPVTPKVGWVECHSVAEIGFGWRIFRDGGSRL